jgi:hypothetical protein
MNQLEKTGVAISIGMIVVAMLGIWLSERYDGGGALAGLGFVGCVLGLLVFAAGRMQRKG